MKDVTTVVVTGGSSGIGKEFIRQLLDIRPALSICNLSRSEPSFFKDFSQIHAIKCDFSDRNSLASGAEQLLKYLDAHHHYGEILFLNNSGFGSYGRFGSHPLEQELAMIDVNVAAPVYLSGKMIPFMMQFGGVIGNVASTASYQPTPMFANYGATKSYLVNWSLALRQELKNTGVKVVTLCPGVTATEFFEHAGIENGGRKTGKMTVQDAVSKMIVAMDKNRPLVVCGFINRVIASFGGLMPSSWMAGIAHKAIRAAHLDKD